MIYMLRNRIIFIPLLTATTTGNLLLFQKWNIYKEWIMYGYRITKTRKIPCRVILITYFLFLTVRLVKSSFQGIIFLRFLTVKENLRSEEHTSELQSREK